MASTPLGGNHAESCEFCRAGTAEGLIAHIRLRQGAHRRNMIVLSILPAYYLVATVVAFAVGGIESFCSILLLLVLPLPVVFTLVVVRGRATPLTTWAQNSCEHGEVTRVLQAKEQASGNLLVLVLLIDILATGYVLVELREADSFWLLAMEIAASICALGAAVHARRTFTHAIDKAVAALSSGTTTPR